MRRWDLLLPLAAAAMLASPLPATGATQLLQSGPVGCWNFDEGSGTVAQDCSGNGHHGAVRGATWGAGMIPVAVPGVLGALRFNGVSDHVEVPNHAQLRAQKLSIEAWINPGVQRVSGFGYAQGNIVTLSATDNNAIGRGYYFGYGTVGASGGVGLCTGDGTGSFECSGASGLPPGRWYHLAATYDGQAQRIYVDGQQVGLRNTTQHSISYTNAIALHVGTLKNSYFGQTWSFNGTIDEVRLYDRALDPLEVQVHYLTHTLPAPACGTLCLG